MTLKRHILARNRVFWTILCQNLCRRLAVCDWKNPKQKNEQNINNIWCEKSRMRRNETPQPIWIKFCRMTDIPDVMTYANFGDDSLRGLGAAGSNFDIPIDFDRHPYNTTVRVCDKEVLFLFHEFTSLTNYTYRSLILWSLLQVSNPDELASTPQRNRSFPVTIISSGILYLWMFSTHCVCLT